MIALNPTSVAAERSGSDGTTIGPILSGPVVSEGSAGFDAAGTSATAGSHAGATPPTPSAGSPGTAGTSDVIYRQIPNDAVPGGGVWVDQSGTIHVLPSIPVSACPDGATGFYTYDANGAALGIVCVSNGADAAPGRPQPTPLELAQQASAEQPWPVLRLSINPATGLTGLPSWFWLSGDPLMPDATVSAGPLTVRVKATLIDVVWNFGDGRALSSGTSVGRPFPADSGIQHVYETDTFARPAGYSVSALLRYEVTFSVNDGPFSLLGVKARPYVASYPVNQLQPQAVSAR